METRHLDGERLSRDVLMDFALSIEQDDACGAFRVLEMTRRNRA